MKINFLILLGILSIFLFSCDSGLKFNNPNDPNNKAKLQQGELGGECYPNNTCDEGLTCDKENNICINDSDISDDSEIPDNNSDKADTAHENGDDEDDTPCTEGTFKCHGAFVSYICRDGEWSHFKECGIDEICNDETGECENPDQEPDTPDTGNTNPYDPTDTADTEGDTEPPDISDTADTEGDTEPTDTGDTEPAEPQQGSCTEIALSTKLTYSDYTIPTYYTTYTPNTGSSTTDTLVIELKNIPQNDVNGTYNLSGTNYSEDGILDIIVLEDDGVKYYFQREGTVVISNYNASTHNIKAELKNVILEEVTLNGSPLPVSTPVSNGACLKVKDTTVSY